MYSVCEKRSQMKSLRDWSGPQFYVSFHFSYSDSLNFAWEKDTGREPQTHTKKKNLRDDVMELPSRAQTIWGWGRSSGKPMKKAPFDYNRCRLHLSLPCWALSENHKAKVSALPARNRPPRFTCIVELWNENQQGTNIHFSKMNQFQ